MKQGWGWGEAKQAPRADPEGGSPTAQQVQKQCLQTGVSAFLEFPARHPDWFTLALGLA